MLSVSTFTHETRPVAFSSRPLIFLPIILVIVLHFFPFAIAFISRVVFLTHVTVAKVVFAVVPRVFADGDTFMCPVSLRDVVALGCEVASSCIIYSGFAILITLLLWKRAALFPLGLPLPGFTSSSFLIDVPTACGGKLKVRTLILDSRQTCEQVCENHHGRAADKLFLSQNTRKM